MEFQRENYKLLALDLDGTLLMTDKTLTDRTRDDLIRAEEQGLRLIIASGRSRRGTLPYAEALRMAEFGGYLLCYNGAVITDAATGNVLNKKLLPTSLYPEFVEIEKGLTGTAIVVFREEDGCALTNGTKDNPYVQFIARNNRMKIVPCDIVRDVRFEAPKFIVVGSPEDAARAEETFRKAIGDRIGVYRSADRVLELVPKGVDKSAGLSIILRSAGLSAGELIACGDSWNDRAMVAMAGFGVAMGNAVAETKAAADYVTLTNDEEGIADFLEKMVLR